MLKSLFLGIVLFCSLLSSASAEEEKSYTFGISPQKSATQLAKSWGPVLAYLSEKSGVNIKFSTAQSSAQFSELLKTGKYDFCYVNPQQYTVLHQESGYTAFAKQKDALLQGIIVMHKDAAVTDLSALQGQKMAFPSPTSFGASVLPQAELKQKGIEVIPDYVKSHDSVYLNVSKNRYVAGGGIMRTFELLDPEIKAQLAIIMTTKSYTPHAIASHATVPSDVVTKVQQAMLTMSQDPQGIALLDAIGFSGLEVAQDAEWDAVRALNLAPVE